jgi:hypothetical protein
MDTGNLILSTNVAAFFAFPPHDGDEKIAFAMVLSIFFIVIMAAIASARAHVKIAKIVTILALTAFFVLMMLLTLGDESDASNFEIFGKCLAAIVVGPLPIFLFYFGFMLQRRKDGKRALQAEIRKEILSQPPQSSHTMEEPLGDLFNLEPHAAAEPGKTVAGADAAKVHAALSLGDFYRGERQFVEAINAYLDGLREDPSNSELRARIDQLRRENPSNAELRARIDQLIKEKTSALTSGLPIGSDFSSARPPAQHSAGRGESQNPASTSNLPMGSDFSYAPLRAQHSTGRGESQNPGRGKFLANAFGFTTIILAVWGGFYPHPYFLVITLLALLPWLAVIMVWKSKGNFTSMSPQRGDRRGSLGLLFLAPALVLAIRALDFGIVSWTPVLFLAICIGLALFLANVVVEPSVLSQPGILILMLIFALAYGYGAGIEANALFDHSPGTVYSAHVIGKHTHHGSRGSTSYYLELSPWGPYAGGDTVTASWSFYTSVKVGDSVCLPLRPGALGVAWFTVERCR